MREVDSLRVDEQRPFGSEAPRGCVARACGRLCGALTGRGWARRSQAASAGGAIDQSFLASSDSCSSASIPPIPGDSFVEDGGEAGGSRILGSGPAAVGPARLTFPRRSDPTLQWRRRGDSDGSGSEQKSQQEAIEATFMEGEFVEVWSNSQQKWLDDGVIVESMDIKRIVDGYKISAGTVKVCFDGGKSFKWVSREDAAVNLRRALPYRWVACASGDAVPPRAALVAGPACQAHVARRQEGKTEHLGWLTFDDDKPGPRKVLSFPGGGKGSGEVLVVSSGFAAHWAAVQRGDALPKGAVSAGSRGDAAAAAEGGGSADACIKRNSRGELTILTPLDGSVPKDTHVLLVQEAQGELEVEVLHLEGLTDAEYRLGDTSGRLMGRRNLRPYAVISLGGGGTTTSPEAVSWRSGFAEASSEGAIELAGEHGRLPLAFAGSRELVVRVFDRRLHHGGWLGGDSLIGAASLRLDGETLAAVEPLTFELERDGRNTGRGLLRLRPWLLRRCASVESPVGTSSGAPVIDAVQETAEGLQERLVRAAGASEELRQTLQLCAEALTTGGPGGIIIVVLDSGPEGPPFEYLDDGLATDLSRSAVGNITEDSGKFKRLLAACCSLTSDDRWEKATLESLAEDLGASAPDPELVGKLKGGAWILSSRGTIRAAAAHLTTSGSGNQLRLPGGQLAGRRHCAAVSAASCLGGGGTVFVRSQAGGVCVVLPALFPGAQPAVVHVPAGKLRGGRGRMRRQTQ
mmetsp:Transcript_127133/g.283381  ORF Transcript_127133/g.283381 Transcript_127133/m.283381 type:complete len:746 (+) Transcript_127133:37-2274(+)